MSGGKGGSTSSSVEIPEYIEKAAQRNLNKAERISQLGYVPYYGPDVAAFTPMQQAAFQNTADVAGAFGMGAPMSQQDIMGGMGAPTQYAGGVSGYSSAPLYEQSLNELAMQRPAQKAYMDSFFINPYSGAQNSFAPIDYNMYPTYAETQRAAQDALTMEDMRRQSRSDENRQRLDDLMGQQVRGSVLNQQQVDDLAMVVDPSGNYDPSKQMTPEQRDYVNDNLDARLALEDIAMANTGVANIGLLDAGKTFFNAGPSFENPSSGPFFDGVDRPPSIGGSYGGSLITGGLSDVSSLPGIVGGLGGGIAGSLFPEASMDAQARNMANRAGSTGEEGNYTLSPEIAAVQAAEAERLRKAQEAAAIVAQVDQNNRDRQNQAQKDQDAANRAQLTRAAQAAQYESERNNAAAIAKLPNVGPVGASGGSGGGSGSSSASSSSSKILCCAYYELGYLPRDIWRLDQRYGVWLHRNNKKLMNGYHAWASPLADFVKRDTIGGKVARKVMWPIVKAWAEEMAHTMSPEKHKSNKVGKVIATVGEAFSYAVGAVLLPKNNKKEA